MSPTRTNKRHYRLPLGALPIGVHHMIRSTRETITPALAAEYLKLNDKNRSLSRPILAKYVAEMAAGKWVENGDAIRFDVNGVLIDGQHRLKAVVVSGCSITCFVIRGLDTSAFASIDSGKRRSASDALTVGGVTNSRTIAGALRVHAQWHGRSLQTNADSLEYFDSHSGITEWVKARYPSGISESLMTAVCYEVSRSHDRETAEKLQSDLADGIGLERFDPIRMAREALIKRNKVNSEESTLLLIKAVNYRLSGKIVKVLKVSSAEEVRPLFLVD